ncbi:MAG: sugar phosphate isomerase/epimerase family protein [Anaerolineales bacterium]
MKIGVQTRPWGPEMNQNQLPDILDDIVAAGYDGFEIGAQHLDLAHPAAFQALLDERGLAVAGIHVGGEIYDPDAVQQAMADLERAMAFAAEVGAPYLPFSGKLKEDKSEAEMQQQAASLNAVGERCQALGLTLCYHNHYWEIENDAAELRYLVEHTDPALVSFCLDLAWVKRGGDDPVNIARYLLDRDRIGYFHLKDTTSDEWMELGRGEVDFSAVLPLITERYDGWLVVEQDEVQRAPVESARISREYLRAEFGI